VHCADFSEKNAFKLGQAVDPHPAVCGNKNNVSVVISEVELSKDMVCLDLVSDKESVGVIYVDIVSMLSHYGKFSVIVWLSIGVVILVLQNVIAAILGIGKCHKYELRRKLEVHGLDRHVLPFWVVDGDTSIDTTRNKQVSFRRVG